MTSFSFYPLTKTLSDFYNLCAEDKYAWMRDDEFGRQALAGVNPIQIELMKVQTILIFEVTYIYTGQC
jgi:hypothetical protein